MLGVIADDLTGAMDAAGLVRRRGVAVSVAFGMSPPSPGVAAHVCALKIRSIPADEAVEQALAACRMLRGAGATRIFYNYCSTFDSTPRGNIGPVAAALADELGAQQVVFVPSFPENGRTVYRGHMFVGDRLLSESSLATHPLNPMSDPDLVRWLTAQASGRVVKNLPLEFVEGGVAAIATWRQTKADFVIADAVADRHIETLGSAFADDVLTTGGSAFCGALVPQETPTAGTYSLPPEGQRAAVIAGSCSEATREQLARIAMVAPVRRIDPVALASDAELPARLAAEALAQDAPIVIASTADPAKVSAARSAVGADVGERVEAALGEVAVKLAAGGVTRFVIAGGETSGAVAKALDATTFEVGEEIAPGVPWARMAGEPPRDFAFKSGNFGGPDFFLEALGMQEIAS